MEIGIVYGFTHTFYVNYRNRHVILFYARFSQLVVQITILYGFAMDLLY